jgi:hypothetical protein
MGQLVYSEALRAQPFIQWLGQAAEEDPNLKSFTDDQVKDAFEAQGLYPPELPSPPSRPPPRDEYSTITSCIYAK